MPSPRRPMKPRPNRPADAGGAVGGPIPGGGGTGTIAERSAIIVAEARSGLSPRGTNAKFFITCGVRGDHHHPAKIGSLPPRGGMGWCFFVSCRASRRLGDEKLSAKTKIRNMKRALRQLPDAPGKRRCLQARASLIKLVTPSGRSAEIAACLCGRPETGTFSSARRWTSAQARAKSLLRKRRTLLVFSGACA